MVNRHLLDTKLHGVGSFFCQKEFDRRSKEQVTSWYVAVRKEQGKVNLYCPECWNKAIKITEDFKKHLEAKYGAVEEE